MVKRKHDPGYKLPEVMEPENCCICIPIPNDFNHKMAFLGQLDELGYWWNWERDTGKNGRLAAAVWRDIVQCIREEMDMAGCGCGSDKGTPTNQRYTDDGHLEVSYDGGETWESGDAIDPRFNSPIFTDIPGADGDAKRCQAANSAMAVIEQAKSDASALLAAGASVAGLVAGIVGLLASTGIGVVAAVVVGIMGAILVAVASGGQAVFDGSFTTLVWDELFCSLFCNMEEDGSFTEAGWQAVVADAATGTSYPANEWLSYIIKTMSPVGLTNAARSGYVGTRDCDSCGCDDEWCYLFDFSLGDGDWSVVTEGGYLNGSWPGAPGWVATDHVNTAITPDTADRAVYIGITLPSRVITKIIITYDFTGGVYNDNSTRALFVSINDTDKGNITRAGMVNGASQTFEINGSFGGATEINVFLRSSRDQSSPYTYSGSALIRSIQVEGTGDNPFGSDNC